MNRVLLTWRIGDNKYYFISKIKDDYIIPQNTATVCFLEGFLIGNNTRDLDNFIIEIPIRDVVVIHYDDYIFKTR